MFRPLLSVYVLAMLLVLAAGPEDLTPLGSLPTRCEESRCAAEPYVAKARRSLVVCTMHDGLWACPSCCS